MNVYIIIAVIIAAAVLLSAGIVFYIRHKRFKPTPDKAAQLDKLNGLLSGSGFGYNRNEDYFYSLDDCWQREAGYCRLYDEGAPLFNMVMDCEPVAFSYGGKRWLIELWKGQYGITTGAEIGVYATDRADVVSDLFTGPFYEPVSDSERLDLSFRLFKNGKVLLERNARHWWLTAFKLGEFSEKSELTMRAGIKFPTLQMCDAFVRALTKIGYTSAEFRVRGRYVEIVYTTPHSPQPPLQDGIEESAVQLVNKNNCNLYRFTTAEYADTPDKLEYIESFVPELFEFMLNSLYAKAFFDKFAWLIQLIRGKKPAKSGKPDNPCKPKNPCKPDNPCKTEPPCRGCRERGCSYDE